MRWGSFIDYLLLLHASSPLQRTVKGAVLAKFIHLFKQTILMEDWLGKEQFSIESFEKAKKYFPLYSNKFVETV